MINKEFPHYEILSTGEIYSYLSHRLLKGGINSDGYLRVNLTNWDGVNKSVLVHILILETFVGPRPSEYHNGAHGPKGKLNNSVSNLRWATPRENQRDRDRDGTNNVGARNGRAILTEDQAREIKLKLKTYVKGPKTVGNIAKEYGVAPHVVHHIKNGKAWKCLP